MGRHIIVESDELYHYGTKGMKWKNHVYATVEKAGNAVKTSAKKAAGAASAFTKKFGKKIKNVGVTAYERTRQKLHEANVKSGYKLKPKTEAAKTVKTAKPPKGSMTPRHKTKAAALAEQEARRKSEMRRSADRHNNKNINKHVNKTDYKAVRADEERVRKSENSAYSSQRQKSEKTAARNRVITSAHRNSPQRNKDRVSELNTNKVVNNSITNAWRNSRSALDSSGLDASQKARVYGFAKNTGREAFETLKRKRRK